MEKIDEVAIRRQNADHLWKIGNLLSNVCPPVSRFYISNLERRINEFPDLLKKKNNVGMPLYCHCGSMWNSNNFTIKIKPPQLLNSHIKKLMKIDRREPWKLNNRQKQKLKKYFDSTSKIVYKCLICQKTTAFPGSKRNRSSSNMSTPATSTPVNKLKLCRGDVNAGLFIPSPILRSEPEKSDFDSLKMLDSSSVSCDSLSISSNASESRNNSSSLSSFKASPEINSKQQSSAKRKKTLLSQILNQEQKKKKKTTLSSFLVSL